MRYQRMPSHSCMASRLCSRASALGRKSRGEISWPSDYPANPIKDDPSAGNAQQMAAFSSRGPTNDSRIKPDVVGNGIDLYSSYAGSDNDYGYSSGTSMSSPNSSS